MKVPAQISISLSQRAIVGTVHSQAALQAARRAKTEECDWLELRVDNFFPNVAELLRAASKLHIPKIVTVRHPAEGGAAPLSAKVRRTLFQQFLPHAALLDIELRSLQQMDDIILAARQSRIGVIFSHHDFKRTPSIGTLRTLARRARDAGADIFKIATFTRTPRDLALLLEFLADENSKIPLAVMGMGPFGKVSRLLLAKSGSCLNYGYLGTPNASGQWPARLLKTRLAELDETP